MNFYEYIKSLFQKKYNTGANLDMRPVEEKQKIFYHEEIATGTQYSKYGTKEEADKAKRYPKENQKRTSSCMAHATALALGIDNELEGHDYVRLSQALMYRKRANYPAEGMILDDVFEIARKIGSCRYELLPTPDTEYEINNVKIPQVALDEAQTYKASNHVNIRNHTDFEVLNSIASQGKAIVVMIYATRREWAQEYPKRMDNITLSQAPIRHGVTILPKSGFIDKLGRKYVIVQDSVPEWNSYHYLDEDWIANRTYGAGYPLNLENKPVQASRPRCIFTTQMWAGQQSEDVKNLQICLKYLGFFPSNSEPTGYFGGITLKAVKDFQTAYKGDILTPVGLEVASGIVGHSTIKKLNELFSS
jgi:hypothetical protein